MVCTSLRPPLARRSCDHPPEAPAGRRQSSVTFLVAENLVCELCPPAHAKSFSTLSVQRVTSVWFAKTEGLLGQGPFMFKLGEPQGTRDESVTLSVQMAPKSTF